jgi:hypothetical protein
MLGIKYACSMKKMMKIKDKNEKKNLIVINNRRRTRKFPRGKSYIYIYI